MLTKSIAKVYANAFFSLSKEKNIIELIYNELKAVKIIFKDKYIYSFFTSFKINNERKFKTIDSLKDFSIYTKNFLKLLINKKRFILINEIINEFENLYKDLKGITDITLIIPFKLDNKTIISTIKNNLSKKYKNNLLNIKIELNKNLIAGFIIKSQNTVIDASLRTKIMMLKEQLN